MESNWVKLKHNLWVFNSQLLLYHSWIIIGAFRFSTFRLKTLQRLSAWQEKFVKRCKAITESISEESSEVEGEWLTYADMQKLEFSERL